MARRPVVAGGRETAGAADGAQVQVDSPSPGQGGVSRPVLLTLALLAAFAPISTDLYLPGFPQLADDLGTNASGVQLTLTTFLAGMACGQLLMGPLSDRFGRRRPLLASAVVCIAAGVVSATAPNLAVLVAARLAQGFAGAGGMVIGRAVISDLVTGRAAARAFTLMLTVGGVAPILAPLVGGLLVGPVGWHGTLWTVTGLCVVMLVAVLACLPETHPPQTRAAHAATSYRTTVRRLLGRRVYWGYTAVFALAFGMMMSYISASPFVYEHVIGLSAVEYGVAFGINAAGLIGAGAVASRLVQRIDPGSVVAAGLVLQVTSMLVLLALVLLDVTSWTFAVPIFLGVLSNGAIMGSSAALAMGEVREFAGTGSAFLGFSQFTVGALVSPLVGLGGDDSAVAPAIVMATCSVLAAGAGRSARRIRAQASDPPTGQSSSESSPSTSTATS